MVTRDSYDLRPADRCGIKCHIDFFRRFQCRHPSYFIMAIVLLLPVLLQLIINFLCYMYVYCIQQELTAVFIDTGKI